MKVLLVNKFHYGRGGAERAYFDTARILESHGHDVAFFSMEHPENLPTPWSKYFVNHVDYSLQYSIGKRISLALSMIWNRQAERNMKRLLDDFKPDIVHFHNIYHQISPSVIRIVKKRNIPMVMTLHDYKLICPNYSMYVRGNIWEGGAWACIRDRCVRDALVPSMVCAIEKVIHEVVGVYRDIDLFLFPSRFLKEKFLEHGFHGKIEVIGQPIALALEPVSPEGTHLLYAGRLSKEKGVDVLLRALVHTPGVCARIAGDGPERGALEKLMHKLHLADRVAFLGHLSRENVDKEYGRALAVVIPSVWNENMPYSLTEALGRGQVVIASRIGGMPERIKNGENGFLFTPGDGEDFSRVIQNLEKTDLKSIRSKARESVSDLTDEAYATKLLSLYDEVRKYH